MPPVTACRLCDDATGEWPEDEPVEWRYGIPVRTTQQTTRTEQGPLHEQRSLPVGRGPNRPLEPGVAGEAHLGAQSQQPRRLEGLNSPEVDDIAYPQIGLMTTSAPHADTADR